MVAQVPPPYHGQAVMQKLLVDDEWSWCEKTHIPMDFSAVIDEVGRPGLMKAWRLARLVWRCLEYRARGPIDVLYYPPSGSSWTGSLRDLAFLLLCRPMAKHTVFHFHAGGFPDSIRRLPSLLRAPARRAYASPDLAIILSDRLRDEVLDLEPVEIATIPNGIVDQWPEGGPLRKWNTSATRVLFVGSVMPEKGVDTLLEAARDTGTNCHFDIVGEFADPAYERVVRMKIADSGLRERVTLHGRLLGDAKWRIYEAASVFCFPSRYPRENQPVAVIEAMMAGLPVILTDWRALPDMVTDGENGIVVPARDPAALSTQIDRLVRSVELRESMGLKARKRFEERYRLADHLSRVQSAVQKVALP